MSGAISPRRAMAVTLVLLAAMGASGSTASSGVVVTRTWHANGAPFEVRRFKNGREEGLQQAWTADGELYLNYEMRNGRRYGFVNARPCAPVEKTR